MVDATEQQVIEAQAQQTSQQDELQRQAEVQRSLQLNAERILRLTVEEARRKNPGIIKQTQVQRVQEFYIKAGLSPELARQEFIQALRSTKEFRARRAIGVREVQEGVSAAQRLERIQSEREEIKEIEQQRVSPTQQLESLAAEQRMSVREEEQMRATLFQEFDILKSSIKSREFVPAIKSTGRLITAPLIEEGKIATFQVPDVLLLSSIPSFPKPTGVFLKGTTQAVKEGKIISRVEFVTTTGGVGKAVGVSEVLGTKGGFSVLETRTLGAGGRRVVDLTKITPRVTTKDIEKFASLQRSLVLSKEEASLFITAGKVGKVVDKTKLINIKGFKGFGGAVSEKEAVYLVERGFVDIAKGRGVSVQDTMGVLKKLPGADEGIKILGRRGTGKIKPEIFQQALTDVQAGISAGVSTPPRIIITQPGVSQKYISKIKIETPKQTFKQPQKIQGVRAISTPSLTQRDLSILGGRNIQQVKQATRTKQLQKLDLSQSLKEVQQLKTIQQVRLTQSQAETQRLKQIQRGRFILSLPPIITQPPIRRGIPLIRLPLWKKGKERKKGEGLFGVQVKRRGKFIQFAKGLSLQKAISVGARETAQSIAQTFRVVPQQKGMIFGGGGIPFGFRRGKKVKPLTFIEKKKFAISTPREKITLAKAKRQKRKGGRKK